MKTIYIDVYFLINFTVDLLSLFFSSSFLRIPIRTARLILASAIGGLYAVVSVLFINMRIVSVLLSVIILALIMLISAPGIGAFRKLKHLMAFLVFQILIGGAVYFGYCMLDRLFDGYSFEKIGGVNRKLIILSVLVLLTVGAVKLLILSFERSTTEKNLSVRIYLDKSNVELEALVDSGNLVRDPFDGTPVMFICAKAWHRLYGMPWSETAAAEKRLVGRLRVIPITMAGEHKIVYAVKCDEVICIRNGKKEGISVLVAVEPSLESFGGFPALMPLSAVNDL